MDECVHSGTLSQCLSALSRELVTDLWACVTEVGWRRKWACICSGREIGGRTDGRWGKNSTQAQSDDSVMGGDQVTSYGQVRSASQTRVHGFRVGVWVICMTYAPWATWVF